MLDAEPAGTGWPAGRGPQASHARANSPGSAGALVRKGFDLDLARYLLKEARALKPVGTGGRRAGAKALAADVESADFELAEAKRALIKAARIISPPAKNPGAQRHVGTNREVSGRALAELDRMRLQLEGALVCVTTARKAGQDAVHVNARALPPAEPRRGSGRPSPAPAFLREMLKRDPFARRASVADWVELDDAIDFLGKTKGRPKTLKVMLGRIKPPTENARVAGV